MKVKILWVGKTKERYMAEGIDRYLDRLKPFADVDVAQIKEQKGVPVDAALRKEGERILKQAGSYILLDEGGRQLSSPEFASLLKDNDRLAFVLGGAYGVSDEVKRGAASTLALSKMTLTHEMARLVFVEQLYRAMMINSGRDYHH